MTRPFGIVATTFLVASITTVASAHTRLTSPSPRSDSDGLKTGPCGNIGRTGAPLTVAGGETMTIAWLETVNHPGYYRLALATGSDNGFDDNVLADNIADENCTATPCSYTADVTFPDIECPDCTLQLIQYMGTAPPYSLYFSCADLVITGAANVPDGGSGPGPGAADGGCQISGGAGSSGVGTALFAFLFVALGTRRLRK